MRHIAPARLTSLFPPCERRFTTVLQESQQALHFRRCFSSERVTREDKDKEEPFSGSDTSSNESGQGSVEQEGRDGSKEQDAEVANTNPPSSFRPAQQRTRNEHPNDKPVSISEEERARLIRRKRFKDLPPAVWTANQATRPLLLTFDAFGTLFHPKDPVEKQYCDVAWTYGLSLSEPAVLASFKKAFKTLSTTHPNYGKATGTTVSAWWSNVIYNTLRPLLSESTPIPNALVQDLFDRFSTSEGYTLFPDVQPLLQLLGTSYSVAAWPPRRTMLGVLSNSDPRVSSVLKSFNIPITPSLFPPRYFPHSRHQHAIFGPANIGFATLSYDVGAAKPDRRFYDAAIRDAQYMLERMAYVAKTTRTGTQILESVRDEFHAMHVGDELDKDVLPAIACGWDGVLLDRTAREEVSEREVQVPVEEEGAAAPPARADENAAVRGATKTVKFPVINNLLAIRQLLTKERFEEADADGKMRPRQKPVYLDESKPWERFADRLPLRDRNKRFYAGRRLVEHPTSTRDKPLVMYV